jgi:transposase InsO family protein
VIEIMKLPTPKPIWRSFAARRHNDPWLSNIKQNPTRKVWLCLTAILDAHSRALVWWAMSRSLDAQLAVGAY